MSTDLSSSQREALRAAAQWLALLGSETSDIAERQAWRNWLQKPVNQWAWERIELLQQNLQTLPGKLAVDTLELTARRQGHQRRSVLKGIVFLAGAGTLGWSSSRCLPIAAWRADHRTATGEIRSFALPDGSKISLNTDSAIDVRFDARQRLVLLRRGEIFIETAHDVVASPRPFLVKTEQVQIHALGTQFSVRQFDEQTRVSVQVDRVEVSLPIAKTLSMQQQIIEAGYSAEFLRDGIISTGNINANDSAWRNRMLVADNWRLDKFLNELGRYRNGILHCDTAVADHRISGAFRIDDTDQALLAITKLFPVRVDYRTRYWALVRPAKKV